MLSRQCWTFYALPPCPLSCPLPGAAHTHRLSSLFDRYLGTTRPWSGLTGSAMSVHRTEPSTKVCRGTIPRLGFPHSSDHFPLPCLSVLGSIPSSIYYFFLQAFVAISKAPGGLEDITTKRSQSVCFPKFLKIPEAFKTYIDYPWSIIWQNFLPQNSRNYNAKGIPWCAKPEYPLGLCQQL